MKIIVCPINGHPKAGKDTFVKQVKEVAPDNIFVTNISSVDEFKQFFPNKKTDEVRRAIATMKDLVVEHNPSHFIQVLARDVGMTISQIMFGSNNFDTCMFFYHERKEELIKDLMDEIHESFPEWKISPVYVINPRIANELNAANLPEADIVDYKHSLFDFWKVNNSKDIKHLKTEAKLFIKYTVGLV